METSGRILVATSSGEFPADVQRVWKNAAAGGDTPLVPAEAGVIIRILAVYVLGGASTTLTFKSDTDACSPDMTFGNNGGVINYNPHGWYETKRGQALGVTLGAGEAMGVTVVYVKVPTRTLANA